MSASSIVEFEQETINNANALLAHVGISSKRVSTSAELGRVILHGLYMLTMN